MATAELYLKILLVLLGIWGVNLKVFLNLVNLKMVYRSILNLA